MSNDHSPVSRDETKPDWAMSRREREAAQRAAQGLPPRKRRGWLWALGILVIAGGAIYLVNPDLPGAMMAQREEPVEEPVEPETQETIMQLLPSEVTEVAPGTLRQTLRLTGTLVPARELAIPAEVSGHVDSIAVREGQRVEAGEVLVQIDIETLQNQLDQTSANARAQRTQLELARTQLERTQNLVERGISSSSALESQQANVDQLTASVAAQDAGVAIAEQSLANATITAPFPGIISDIAIDEGAYVGTGTVVLTLVNIDSLVLEASVPVIYAPRVAAGQPVEVTVDGAGGDLFEGDLERVSPVAASGTRMLPVYASLDNADQRLKGGMFATGELILATRTGAIGVPADALRADEDGSFVLVIEDGRALRRAVETGDEWDRGRIVEITEGLSEGDMIVSEDMPQLLDGMAVAMIDG